MLKVLSIPLFLGASIFFRMTGVLDLQWLIWCNFIKAITQSAIQEAFSFKVLFCLEATKDQYQPL
jgi:hypothetical protein